MEKKQSIFVALFPYETKPVSMHYCDCTQQEMFGPTAINQWQINAWNGIYYIKNKERERGGLHKPIKFSYVSQRL